MLCTRSSFLSCEKAALVQNVVLKEEATQRLSTGTVLVFRLVLNEIILLEVVLKG